MIKIDKIETWGIEHAIRGMRNPMNSWDKSDSKECRDKWCKNCRFNIFESNASEQCGHCGEFIVGDNDLTLMRKLFKAGTEHRKYTRQIMVSMDITAPLYWWKEFDTYKVGTTANSCSTMHKIHEKEFTRDDFSCEHLFGICDSYDEYLCPLDGLFHTIKILNYYRNRYIETKQKNYWWQMIQLLPSSYNQTRTVTMTYENVFAMIHQRKGHKLDEWQEFVKALLDLPYVAEISGGK